MLYSSLTVNLKPKPNQNCTLANLKMKTADPELYKRICQKLTPTQIKAFDGAITSMQDVVKDIESLPPVTKNHYGHYLRIANSNINVAILMLAGANTQGVRDAARINGVKGF